LAAWLWQFSALSLASLKPARPMMRASPHLQPILLRGVKERGPIEGFPAALQVIVRGKRPAITPATTGSATKPMAPIRSPTSAGKCS
jgi:hypothetical protein